VHPDEPPELAMVAIDGPTVQFYRATARGGLDEIRAVDAPADIDTIRWLGKTLAVLTLDDDRRVPQVGTVTQSGFTAFALPPAAAWPDTKLPDLDHFDPPQWSLVNGGPDELWLGRCEWGYYGEGSNCQEWAWARVGPAANTPFAITRTTPKGIAPAYKLATVTPPPAMRVELVDDPGAGPDETKRKILRCTRDRKSIEFPPTDERHDGFLGMSDIVWVAADPPMFRVSRSESCMDVCTTELTFEGCTLSKRFETARIVPGPGGTYALVADDFTSVRWRGKELGRIDGARHDVAFAPP
jgi:hypothetical protein